MALDLVRVPVGSFKMGSDEREIDRAYEEWSGRLIDASFAAPFRSWLLKEAPEHEVSLAAFAIMRFPVTNAEFARYCDASRCERPESLSLDLPGDHPVWGVTHSQARRYACWRGWREGLDLRLPTEAEWERAAGGPNANRYPFGDEFDPARCNTVEAKRGGTTPVTAFEQAASGWGVVDMAGNVEEWTSGGYAPYPGGRPVEDDLGRLAGPNYPVLRGGSFLLGGDLARTRRRHGRHPGDPFRITGFRLAVSENRHDSS